MLTLAHESIVPNTSRGWATLTSFAMQATAVVVGIFIPLLQPGLLPRLDLTPHLAPIFLPRMEAPAVQRNSSSNPVVPSDSAFVAPRWIPTSINRRPDTSKAADAEPPCVGCVPGIGQPSTLPTGMDIAISVLPPLPKPVTKPPRVSVMMDGYLTRRVQPEYPSPARQARVQGPVEIAAVISRQGTIENLQVLSGHPMLIPAALNAVRQWRYRPYILNGDPIEVNTRITVTFSLGGN